MNDLRDLKNDVRAILKSFDDLKEPTKLVDWGKQVAALYSAVFMTFYFSRLGDFGRLSFRPHLPPIAKPEENSQWPYLIKWLNTVHNCLKAESEEEFEVLLAASSSWFNDNREVILDEIEHLIEA